MRIPRSTIVLPLLALALATGAAFGLGDPALAQQPPTFTIPIPSQCVHINGFPGMPGRKGIGVLEVPISPEAQAFMASCTQLGFAGVTASLTGFWVSEHCPMPPEAYSVVGQLYASIDPNVKTDLGWDWSGVPLPACGPYPQILLAVAEGYDPGDVRPHGAVTLSCCQECPSGPNGD
jgi:hypothetical protein